MLPDISIAAISGTLDHAQLSEELRFLEYAQARAAGRGDEPINLHAIPLHLPVGVEQLDYVLALHAVIEGEAGLRQLPRPELHLLLFEDSVDDRVANALARMRPGFSLGAVIIRHWDAAQGWIVPAVTAVM